MLSILALAFSPAVPLQTVGGGWDEQRRFHGPAAQAQDGGRVVMVGDVTGDGYADFVTASAAPFSSYASLRSGKNGQRLVVWQYPSSWQFGAAIAGVKDLDGDGLRDILISAPQAISAAGNPEGAVFAFSSASKAELFRIDGRWGTDGFGSSLVVVEDLNRDGIQDYLVGSPWGPNFGRVTAISGRNHSELYLVTEAGALGHAIAALDDIDGDGVNDFATSAPFDGSGGVNRGRIYFYSGANGDELTGPPIQSNFSLLGYELTRVEDVDADGYSDLLASAGPRDGFVLFSGKSGLVLKEFPGSSFGRAAASCDDLTGDGVADFALAGPGRVSLISGASLEVAAEIHGDPSQEFAAALACDGDLNGDGHSEILIGIPLASSQPGTLDLDGATVSYQFEPQLGASATQISASAGGALGFRINFPVAAAGEQYRLLLSATGTGPTWRGVEVPLTVDALTTRSWAGIYWPAKAHQAHGPLDASGDARPKLVFPAQVLSSLVGTDLYCAAVAHPSGSSLLSRSSVAVPITIVP